MKDKFLIVATPSGYNVFVQQNPLNSPPMQIAWNLETWDMAVMACVHKNYGNPVAFSGESL